MTTLTADDLAQLTIATLERTAFMLADPAETDPAAFARTTRAAIIRYHGPQAGQVELRTTDGFLRGLAAGLLGVEPDDIDLDASGEDAIRELTNIVGGSVVATLGGANSTYSLGLPQTVPPASLPGRPRATTCALHCEGHTLYVTWIPDAADAAKAA
ncbi:MAG: chemotaxis protein CheX [Planctomycetota bacterium]|nr:chemotaxis protein CheX [Planctomycetota bacterium]